MFSCLLIFPFLIIFFIFYQFFFFFGSHVPHVLPATWNAEWQDTKQRHQSLVSMGQEPQSCSGATQHKVS